MLPPRSQTESSGFRNSGLASIQQPRRMAPRKRAKQRVPKTLNSTSDSLSYFDYQTVASASSTPTQSTILGSLLGTGGLLSSFPAHATPVYQNGLTFLRQRIHLTRMEVRLSATGSQSNTIVAGDLFNTIRFALFLSGPQYTTTNALYLTGLNSGTNLVDVEKLYIDDTFSLPSQAYDVASSYNVPQTITRTKFVNFHLPLDIYSTTTSGTGSWESRKWDIVFNVVSDSVVAPAPTIAIQIRTFLTFK